MKQNEAYILLPTVVILSVLSMAFILQNAVFNQQLQAKSKLIDLAKVDKIQIVATMQISKDSEKIMSIDNAKVRVVNKQMEITLGRHIYDRKLLVKSP
ncbi:hypothetical protein GCM10025879_07110 [Leuconostoc litchii]|uniref:Uncharacterized protein n=1 Tax=Leuconostoc litchii TaxID=1981069 RepID=A0A6P2CT55_9LACO|nr:hypothetical protein [Leuconostoc litchii]TYC47447.1 hypothetical protein ESZ47_04725 [Leuconostoc litchii]GMA69465.1 hypothetical protein GCM10025879_07110 [Leuconostoc litchii]